MKNCSPDEAQTRDLLDIIIFPLIILSVLRIFQNRYNSFYVTAEYKALVNYYLLYEIATTITWEHFNSLDMFSTFYWFWLLYSNEESKRNKNGGENGRQLKLPVFNESKFCSVNLSVVSSSGFFYKSKRCSKTTSVPLLLALTNLVRIERTVLASSNSFIRSRSLMVDTNKYYQGFPDSSRCKCSASVLLPFTNKFDF